ncbi:hypothetical protein ['Paenibacillus yunnanensis' Narsing Rao et al. 2020]|uniref:hypothetical protein n=1 Tax=Paenibacillus tengchongensis TaxID=2608684 RepID=UPI0016524BFA|nr:hypothetical protein [Paenibacillus tengchongensis]
MTTTKLILVEGLPGAGKSTIAQLTSRLLAERGLTVKLFLEGNPAHPADAESIACLTGAEYAGLLQAGNEQQRQLFMDAVSRQGGDYLLPYGLLEQKTDERLPDDLRQVLAGKDVYELPLAHNREIIAGRWRDFGAEAQSGETVYVFECCFIQNPVTIGMIKNGATFTEVQEYVTELAESVKALDPLVIYIEQKDLEFTFRKALRERPREWSEGFMDYYTGQGFAKTLGVTGISGTIQVLEARAVVERRLVEELALRKAVIDNSAYDFGMAEQELRAIIEKHID